MAKEAPHRKKVRKVAPAVIDYAERVIYGEVWERPGLTKRERSMITLAALVAMGREGQMKGHFTRALQNGVTKTEIAEILTHLSFYCGWPASITASLVAHDVMEKPSARKENSRKK